MPTSASTTTSLLSPTQRYGAGALFAIALHQAQIHQASPLGFPSEDNKTDEERISSASSSSDSVGEDPHLWVHENSDLLRPVFRFLDIDSAAWTGLEETSGSSPASHHIGALLRLLAEEGNDASSDQQTSLVKAVDTVEQTMGTSDPQSSKNKKEKQKEYENECREKLSTGEVQSSEGVQSSGEVETDAVEKVVEKNGGFCDIHDAKSGFCGEINEESLEVEKTLNHHTKVTVLYELLSACLADLREGDKKCTRRRKGYDAKHRVALRLLTTWLNIRWTTMEAMEIMLASSAMAVLMEEETKAEEGQSSKSKWAKWKRGGIIVAAAITGGALSAVTGGLAAPAIAAGFGALAPTLGTIIPVIGASGFAAAATAAGSVAGSVAVAASFGDKQAALERMQWELMTSNKKVEQLQEEDDWDDVEMQKMEEAREAYLAAVATAKENQDEESIVAAAKARQHLQSFVLGSDNAAGAGLAGTKMARRTGSVDEFEFIAIGENHKQGRLAVGIVIAGFVFEKEDFIRPWEGQIDNGAWESKNLIAVSTAIQDWLTSSIAMGLMKQGAMLTVLSSLLVALAWPATLLAATDFIDSKWTIAVDRSDKAGKLLAEVLLKGLQGNRPVALVGYSLGARVIFKCLQTLAETEPNAEIVERVVLLGAPISIKDQNWEAARKMVSGRFVNAYSSSDWMLGIAFRASLLTQGLAGIQPINVLGIENVDVTDLIEGHSSYLWATQRVVDQLELDAYYPVFRSSLPRP